MPSFRLLATSLATVISVGSATNCAGIQALSPRCKSAEVPYTRDYFYVGGEYVPSVIPGQSMVSGQMYVEKLTPAQGANKTHPLVFISAGVPSGTVWLNTPDNRKGWASHFVEAGYQVYIVDITGNGRSGQNQVADFPLKMGSTDNITQDGFTAPEHALPYPQAINHTQWPGTGLRGDAVFDAFQASMVPLTSNSSSQEATMRAAGCALLDIIGEAVTVCHSGSCQYSVLMADECPARIRAAINLEPSCLPFQSLIGNATVPSVGRTAARPWGLTSTPLHYDPPATSPEDLRPVEVGVDAPHSRSCFLQSVEDGAAPRLLPRIAQVPFVMYTGSASPHAAYDHCVALYLNQTGVPNEWIKLADRGIEGNGHFFFLEKNHIEIAALVEEKLEELVQEGGDWIQGDPSMCELVLKQ